VQDSKGQQLHWGQLPYEQIYGVEGYCNLTAAQLADGDVRRRALK
jgi:hypothetical protein